ncbi:hypothetical protein P261_02898 [Lachnospiraceae bacterium TWA4]|nr:hypothetical protein P261_02898 [Lachnospiraceae bacterium TWA4]
MRKSKLAYILAFLLCVAILWLIKYQMSFGNVEHVEMNYGKSTVYQLDERKAAAETILEYFKNGFEGCKFYTLTYLEDDTLKYQQENSEGIMIFHGRFKEGFLVIMRNGIILG